MPNYKNTYVTDSTSSNALRTSNGNVFAANSNRKGFVLQNLSTGALIISYSGNTASMVNLHYILKASTVQDDSTGGTLTSDVFTGPISASGYIPTVSPRFLAYEFL